MIDLRVYHRPNPLLCLNIQNIPFISLNLEKYLTFHISDRSFAYTESEPVTEQQTPAQPQSRTAPGRLEAHDTDSEEEHFNLKKVGSLLLPEA